MNSSGSRLQFPVAAPPGVIVAHSPKSGGLYIGSPSICILPDGDYVASHDLFGPASKEHQCATARVYRSSSQGERWDLIAEPEGQFWSGLFVHRGALYLMGTNRHYGNLIIRRSTDGGRTWEMSIIRSGQYHTGPVPVLVHAGRIWRAVERADGAPELWSKMMSAQMFSAPEDADLLNPASWQESNALPYDASLLSGAFHGWLEGNAVAAPDGTVWNMLRVHNPADKAEERAAIVQLNNTGDAAVVKGFTNFPGGGKKFTIRHDAVSGRYWTIANYVPEAYRHDEQLDKVRNTQALCSSADLLQWEVNSIVLQHEDRLHHGFNYADWQFNGDDIIFVSRTAYHDEEGGAESFHNANYLTFHRIHQFRSISQNIHP